MRPRPVAAWALLGILAAALPIAPRSAGAQVDPGRPFVAPAASVELSWDEVRAMIERLIRHDVEASSRLVRPPVDALLRAASFTVSIGEGVLLADGTIDVEVLAPGWCSVPLLGRPVAVRSFDAGPGGVARPMQGADGGVAAVLHGAGPRRISLSYAVGVEAGLGPRIVALPMPRAASVEVVFRADSRVENASADGAVQVRSAPLDGARGRSHVFAVRDPVAFALRFVARRPLDSPEAAAGSAGPGTDADEPAGAKQPRYRASTSIDVAVDFIAVRATVEIDLEIRDAPIESFDIAPLDDWEVVGVDLRGSDEPVRIEQSEGKATIRLAYPVADRAVVRLVLERGNEERIPELLVPVISVAGAYRQEAVAGVRLDSAIEGAVTAFDGGTPADPSEVSLPAGARAQFAFRFHRVPYSAGLALRYHEPIEVLAAAVDRATIRVAATRDGRTVVRAAYVVRNSRRSYLAVTPPRGAEVWGAFVDGVPVTAGAQGDRPGAVLVALSRVEFAPGVPRPSRVEVIYFLRGKPVEGFSGWSFEPPGVDLPVSAIEVAAHLPPDLRYRPKRGTLEPVEAWDEQPASGDKRGQDRLDRQDTGVAYGRVADDDLAGKPSPAAGEVLTRGALAAEFRLPEDGVLLRWRGSIVLPGERVVVEAASRPAWFDDVAWPVAVLLWLAAGALLAGAAWTLPSRASRRRGVLFALGACACGAALAALGLFAPVPSPILAAASLALVVAALAVVCLVRRFRVQGAAGAAPASPSA